EDDVWICRLRRLGARAGGHIKEVGSFDVAAVPRTVLCGMGELLLVDVSSITT
ncbi:jg26055, partial [Pararge aegeria aegeria]